MSNNNLLRARLKKATCNHEYRILYLQATYPPYYEEGWTWKNPNLPNYKAREFKTWKHNRKKQYKK